MRVRDSTGSRVTIREHRERTARTQKLSETLRRRMHRMERKAGIVVTLCRANIIAPVRKDTERS
jgi:hypothetical protein